MRGQHVAEALCTEREAGTMSRSDVTLKGLSPVLLDGRQHHLPPFGTCLV